MNEELTLQMGTDEMTERHTYAMRMGRLVPAQQKWE
jgi:hypothetical protein